MPLTKDWDYDKKVKHDKLTRFFWDKINILLNN